MTKAVDLKLAFYGDDITGSTDGMEALVRAGVPTVLCLEPLTKEFIHNRFPEIQAIGLAGMSRTMSPEEMDAALPGVFRSLKEFDAPITHYKVCSTFDSSPTIGSIGRAVEIGMDVFQVKAVPVAVGAPKLKRFVVFGNHFATLDDSTYRLDRHPVMSVHPITPMDESDLRLHLAKQTKREIGLIDIHHLAENPDRVRSIYHQMVNDGIEIVILDTLDQSHSWKVGNLLWNLGQETNAFVVGSSGVEFALAEYWQAEFSIQPPGEFRSVGAVGEILAISGSASLWSASQIQTALDSGFWGIPMNSEQLLDPGMQEAERSRLVDQAAQKVAEGQSVIIYSALGRDDPKIALTKDKAIELGLSPRDTGKALGTQQGIVLKETLKKTGLRRTAVVGGDTCGYVLKQLSIFLLEFIVPLGKAAPLCGASSHDPFFNGMEISLKGGQLGDLDYFKRLRNGK